MRGLESDRSERAKAETERQRLLAAEAVAGMEADDAKHQETVARALQAAEALSAVREAGRQFPA